MATAELRDAPRGSTHASLGAGRRGTHAEAHSTARVGGRARRRNRHVGRPHSALRAGRGLSGAVTASSLVVTAGIAEVVAESIAMGLGGYLAARSEAEHYASELRREQAEVVEKPEAAEVRAIFEGYGLSPAESARVAEALRARPEAWIDFMMSFELGLEAPDPKRALTSALTIAGAYVVGGLVPLAPYMLEPTARGALVPSVLVTLAALAVFGYVKGRYTGAAPLRSAVQTVVIGGLAAAAAFGIAR